MSLKHYYINAQGVSLKERTALFSKLEDLSFITALDLNNLGCIEVFWDLKDDIEKVIAFPPECTLTTICKSE